MAVACSYLPDTMASLLRRHLARNYNFRHVNKTTKVTTSFIISVQPTARNNSVPTGQIVMKFDIGVFFINLLRKVKFH